MWMSFAWRVCDIRVHMRCVCVQLVAVKRSKVWAHVTKLTDSSIRCSSEMVNKGGNTSNMKHLLSKHNIYVLKQCAVFTIQLQLQLARHIHIKCLFSGSYTHETLHLFAVNRLVWYERIWKKYLGRRAQTEMQRRKWIIHFVLNMWRALYEGL